jgi:hypothetical protein
VELYSVVKFWERLSLLLREGDRNPLDRFFQNMRSGRTQANASPNDGGIMRAGQPIGSFSGSMPTRAADWFGQLAAGTAIVTGRPGTFLLAVLVVLARVDEPVRDEVARLVDVSAQARASWSHAKVTGK